MLDYISPQNITNQLSSLQLSQKYHRRVEREAPQRVGGLLLVTAANGAELAYQVDAEPTGVNTAALVLGTKWNVSNTWLANVNVSLPLIDRGLRSDVVVLFGVDYAFEW